MIKVIFFDQGGVLVKEAGKEHIELLSTYSGKSFDKCKLIRKKYWKRLKVGLISDEEFWLGSKKFKNLQKGILSELNINSAMYKELRKKTINTILKFGFVEVMLGKLYRKHVLGIISNNSCDWGERVLKNYKFEKYFKMILFSHNEGMAKPDEKIYKLARSRLDFVINPEEILFIDDKEKSLAPARKLGWNTILFRSEEQLRKELTSFSIKI